MKAVEAENKLCVVYLLEHSVGSEQVDKLGRSVHVYARNLQPDNQIIHFLADASKS